MLWKLFQLAVFFGVFALFVENDVRDLGMVPVLTAALAALLATVILGTLIDLARSAKALLLRRGERINERRLPRV
jgi:hypothetical protein